VKPLGLILGEIGEGASAAGISEQLFLLYQFGVLNVFPAKPVAEPACHRDHRDRSENTEEKATAR
jgi:hypothetical protein